MLSPRPDLIGTGGTIGLRSGVPVVPPCCIGDGEVLEESRCTVRRQLQGSPKVITWVCLRASAVWSLWCQNVCVCVGGLPQVQSPPLIPPHSVSMLWPRVRRWSTQPGRCLFCVECHFPTSCWAVHAVQLPPCCRGHALVCRLEPQPDGAAGRRVSG